MVWGFVTANATHTLFDLLSTPSIEIHRTARAQCIQSNHKKKEAKVKNENMKTWQKQSHSRVANRMETHLVFSLHHDKGEQYLSYHLFSRDIAAFSTVIESSQLTKLSSPMWAA